MAMSSNCDPTNGARIKSFSQFTSRSRTSLYWRLIPRASRSRSRTNSLWRFILTIDLKVCEERAGHTIAQVKMPLDKVAASLLQSIPFVPGQRATGIDDFRHRPVRRYPALGPIIELCIKPGLKFRLCNPHHHLRVKCGSTGRANVQATTLASAVRRRTA